MALSFLSGNASNSSNIKALEARAYALEAAKGLMKLKNLEAMSENLEFLGLDEISAPAARRRPRPNERSKPAPTTGGGGTSMKPNTTPGKPNRTQIIDQKAPIIKSVTKTEAAPFRGTEAIKKAIESGELKSQLEEVEENRRMAEKAAEESQNESESKGFFQGKNLLIIGGVALAAIAGIYFLNKKK